MKSLLSYAALGVLMFCSVQCRQIGPPAQKDHYWAPSPNTDSGANTPRPGPSSGSSSTGQKISFNSLKRQVNWKADMVPRGKYGRRGPRSMRPSYITIHSTQNSSADAYRHGVALKRGALRTGQYPGYLIWHFTVDTRVALQHLPLNEQGVHADFAGPGNKYSIGIEVCENRGGNLGVTIDRTAKLTALLMRQQGIPLSHVVPHYHWPRKGKTPPHKNCPHFLLDNGRPGKKWKAFLNRVNYYYNAIE